MLSASVGLGLVPRMDYIVLGWSGLSWIVVEWSGVEWSWVGTVLGWVGLVGAAEGFSSLVIR